MKSRDSIKRELTSIANGAGYRGEMVDIATDLISYVLYHNQLEITNAVRESSLSTAKLMNSKITECMNQMYSVYRGENARVKLKFIPQSVFHKNKYESVYESNTFKLYAASNYNIVNELDGEGNAKSSEIECIFAKKKHTRTYTITSNNRYYIDLTDENGHLLSNVSEDVKVIIDGVEYPTTRSFYEHVNTPVSDDPSKLDKIFVMTIPDYGVRLFKKGWLVDEKTGETKSFFMPNSEVTVECFEYMTSDDVNESEFRKINIQGTTLVPYPQSEGINNAGRILIDEVARDDGESILYNANLASRVQCNILSNSDVNYLFTEYFRNKLVDSIHVFEDSKNKLDVFYIPRNPNKLIQPSEVDAFSAAHKSYFITSEIHAYNALKAQVQVNINLYLNDNSDISNDIKSIFDEYSGVLPKLINYVNDTDDNPDNENSKLLRINCFNQLFDYKSIVSKISKISNVYYVDEFRYGYGYENSDLYVIIPEREGRLSFVDNEPYKLPTSYFDNVQNLRVPLYYEFKLALSYKNKYESIS